MKKIVSLVLVLIMVAAVFSGCSKDPAKALVGTWVSDYDATDMLTEALAERGMDGLTTEEKLVVTMYITFNEDKTCTFGVDEEATTASLTKFMESFADAMAELMYTQAEASGIDRETLDAQFEAQYSCTVSEYMASSFSSISPEDLMIEKELANGVYQVKGDKLYVEDTAEDFNEEDYVVFTLEGSTLTFTSFSGDALDLDEDVEAGFELPFTFTKK